MLASFAAESPLTGFGAGGFMLVHRDGPDGGESTLIDFFVEAPGIEGTELGAQLIPVDVEFERDAVQVFNVGAASCGVPGAAAGLAHAIERFASMPAEALVAPAAAAARDGLAVTRQQGYLFKILAPDLHGFAAAVRGLRAGGRSAARGRHVPLPPARRGSRALRSRGARAVL